MDNVGGDEHVEQHATIRFRCLKGLELHRYRLRQADVIAVVIAVLLGYLLLDGQPQDVACWLTHDMTSCQCALNSCSVSCSRLSM